MAAKNPAKILVVFGTRPEAIKLFPLVAALKADPRFDCKVCVSAQHRGILDQVLEIAGIVPDHDLDLMKPDQTLDGLTAELLTGLGQVMDAEKPDRVIVQGDTATAMCGALAAYYRKVPVDHVEAGLRSGNIYHPWPEEVNRKIIGTMASLHFAPTDVSAASLIAEQVDPARVHITGNTVIDALHWVTARIAADPSLASGLAELEARFAGKRIIGVTSHRRENFGGGLDNVALIEPLDYPHFARLLGLAEIMLTDSGGVQEEAPALGKPVLVMRETTERPEGVTAGTAKLVGTDVSRIVTEIFTLLDDKAAYEKMARAHNPFGDGQTARRIVELLLRETGQET